MEFYEDGDEVVSIWKPRRRGSWGGLPMGGTPVLMFDGSPVGGGGPSPHTQPP